MAGDTKNISGYIRNESGDMVESTVATLTFGVAGGAEFTEATWNYDVDGFQTEYEINLPLKIMYEWKEK